MEDNNNENVYQSCSEVELGQLVVLNHIGNLQKCLSVCGNMSLYHIASRLTNNPEESVSEFINFRQQIIDENKRVYFTDNKERVYTIPCIHCPSYQVRDWNTNIDKIQHVNLSILPSPCQSKCVYCGHIRSDNKITDEAKEGYENLFKVLNYIIKNNLDNNITCQISSGEISIHPYRKRIFDAIRGIPSSIFSNCFVFNQSIANHLKTNPFSVINLSIDSGTPETWRKVKGFNNFSNVINNLRKYRQYCNQENYQQIQLKYIMLLGINNNTDDYNGVIGIMKELKVEQLIISRDFGRLYDPSSNEYKVLMDSIIDLAKSCVINGMKYKLHDAAFTKEQINYIDNTVFSQLQC